MFSHFGALGNSGFHDFKNRIRNRPEGESENAEKPASGPGFPAIPITSPERKVPSNQWAIA
jgi:hypothetical protein